MADLAPESLKEFFPETRRTLGSSYAERIFLRLSVEPIPFIISCKATVRF